MAIAETAKMVAELDLKTGKFTKGVSNAVGSVGKLSSAVAKSRAVAVGLGVGLERAAEFGLRALSGAISDGIQGALTLEKAQAQTQAAITSTGNAAGQTVQSIRDLANSLEDLTTADDKTIQQGENLLLTFTGIGQQVFPEATKAMVNMAIALNKGDAATADFDGTAIKLGKALNDPVKGLTALTKAGVVFSAAQADQIKKLAGQGNALKDLTTAHIALTKEQKAYVKDLGGSVGPLTAARKAGVKLTKSQEAMLKAMEDGSGKIAAQRIILAELEKEFGQAGAAAGTGFTADINRANDAIEDAQIAIAQGLIPAVGEVARELSTVLRDPQVIQGLKNLGVGIGDAIKGAVAFAKTVPWGTIASSLQAAAGFAKDLLNAFLGLPTWVQTAVITGWGLNKLSGGALSGLIGSLASGLIKGVLGINAGVVNVNAATVTGAGGLPGAVSGGAAGVAKTGLSAISKVFLVGEAIGLALAVNEVRNGISDASTKQATEIETQTQKYIASQPNMAALSNSLAGVDKGINDLQSNPLNVLVQGEALDKLRGMRADLLSALTQSVTTKGQQAVGKGALEGDPQSANDIRENTWKTKLATDTVATNVANAKTAIDASAATIDSAVGAGATRSASATYSGAATVAGAVRASRPIVTTNVDVHVTAATVTKSVTVQSRYGPGNGSAGGGYHDQGSGIGGA